MRLINADDAKEYARNHLSNPYEIMSTCAMIDSTDTEDAKIIVHGMWIDTSEPDEDKNVETACSICHAGDKHAVNVTVPYCWHCGAKMDL